MKNAKYGITLILMLAGISLGTTAICQTGTFTEIRQIACGDTAFIGSLGYPTWNPPQIIDRPDLGHAVLLGDFVEPNLLQYIAPICYSGNDTLVIECAHATQITCDTGIYIFEISCPESIQTVYPAEVMCNDSTYVDNLSGFWGPAIFQAPEHGYASIILEPTDGAGVFYRPDQGFEGLDAVKVELTATHDTVLYLFQVYCEKLVSSQYEPIAREIDVYPNPTDGNLFFELKEAILTAEIFDSAGRRSNCGFGRTGQGWMMDTHNLGSGAYLLRITTATGVYTNRFIRN